SSGMTTPWMTGTAIRWPNSKSITASAKLTCSLLHTLTAPRYGTCTAPSGHMCSTKRSMFLDKKSGLLSHVKMKNNMGIDENSPVFVLRDYPVLYGRRDNPVGLLETE